MIKKISAKELYEKIQKHEKVTLLDVRAEEKFNEYHIQTDGTETLNINKKKILEGEEDLTTLPDEEEIVVTCTTGNSATKCATILAQKEYNVTVLEGGITAWKEYLKTL